MLLGAYASPSQKIDMGSSECLDLLRCFYKKGLQDGASQVGRLQYGAVPGVSMPPKRIQQAHGQVFIWDEHDSSQHILAV